ncbi:MAG: hypothetical protein U1F30_04380 [Steroidobacteraceae bacterium]
MAPVPPRAGGMRAALVPRSTRHCERGARLVLRRGPALERCTRWSRGPARRAWCGTDATSAVVERDAHA